ncbi:hypothetical protein QE320_gp018 [Pseudomonas phage EM]|uniref:Uncharacterized protein n=1 Tax=Pseudomonas phage EM TaxID=2936914 RepID=A0AAE9HGD2_9CAUD|nr:hypothetical protein QE320_gp018 [Pseudomonas phage EM]UPW35820.1 hypothetical protein EM_018 [Pseudomonas phage EM]
MNVYMWWAPCKITNKDTYFTCASEGEAYTNRICGSKEEAARFFVQTGCELIVKWHPDIGYTVRATSDENFVTVEHSFSSSGEAERWIELIMADNSLSGYESMDTEGRYVYF